MRVEDIRTICNLGTGTMGFGTALMFAVHGYEVRMFGRSPESIQRGFNGIGAALETYRQNGLLFDDEIPSIVDRI